jgi:superfamily II DNA or RNA helicase
VRNNAFTVQPVGPELREYLDQLTRFPTAQAVAQASGWRPPEAGAGERYWDGWIRLARFRGDQAVIPTGLLPLVQAALASTPTPLHVLDRRERPEDGIPEAFQAIQLRPYQRAAVAAALAAGRGVLDMPPRAGKTLTALELQRQISLPFVWITPTRNIMAQTVRAAEQHFGPGYMAPLTGSGWEAVQAAPIVICTAATARQLPAAFYRTRQGLLIDEVHHAAADTYHQVVAHCDHVFYRYGLSGTFRRSGNDELALHAVLSNVVFRVDARDLVRLGHLVETDVVFLPVDGPRARSGSSFQTGVGRTGIYQHDYRNDLAAWAAVTCWSRRHQVIVLVATKEQGRRIMDRIGEHVPRLPGAHWDAVEFVSTDRPAAVCQAVIDSFVQGTGVQILVGTSMIGEGTDLPAAETLIYAPGGKAEVTHAQAAYRVCTAAPGKRRALIVDFADRHHATLLDHAAERLDTYAGQPIFHSQVLPAAELFPGWLDARGVSAAGDIQG